MNRFKNILFVMEESPDQGSVLARAVSLAESHRAGLTVLDVVHRSATVKRFRRNGKRHWRF